MRCTRCFALMSLCVVLLAVEDCDEVRVATGDPRVRVTEEADLAQPAAGVQSVALATHNGEITVTGTAAAETIAVHIVKKAGGKDKADATACLNAIEIVSEVEDDTYKVGWKWATPKKRHWQASVAFDARVPNEMTVAATTNNGRVRLAKMVADAEILTHNGAVEVEDVAANVRATTHNGRIRVENLTGNAAVETHNGEINLQCVAENIQAVTHNGRIEADVSGSRAFHGRLETNNGAVRVRLGDTASVQVRCHTDNGGVRADRDIDTTVRKKNRLEGTVGGGDGRLEVHTANGSITLR